jgi:hypothetical protein
MYTWCVCFGCEFVSINKLGAYTLQFIYLKHLKLQAKHWQDIYRNFLRNKSWEKNSCLGEGWRFQIEHNDNNVQLNNELWDFGGGGKFSRDLFWTYQG